MAGMSHQSRIAARQASTLIQPCYRSHTNTQYSFCLDRRRFHAKINLDGSNDLIGERAKNREMKLYSHNNGVNDVARATILHGKHIR